MVANVVWERPSRDDVYRVANAADVAVDSSAAVEWVSAVLDRVREAVAYRVADEGTAGEWLWDMLHECADGAVPIYTGEVWEVFVGVRGWQWSEEVRENFGTDPSGDMSRDAGEVLYWVAERLGIEDLRAAGWEL